MNHSVDDVISTLHTMLEGDDVDFEPIDETDEIWDLIDFDPNGDETPEEFVEGLDELTLGVVVHFLIEAGYLT